MLLAVLDLARAGQLKENVILYSPDLLDRFATYFAVGVRVDALLFSVV